MKALGWPLTAVAMLLGFDLGSAQAQAAPSTMAPARVEFVQGKATTLPEGKTVAPGATVPEGMRLQVPDDGFLQLRLADGSLLRVLARSDIQMRRLRRNRTTGRSETIVDVRRGQVESEVVPKKPGRVFEIRAPGAVASVRGTRFAMSVDPDGRVGIAVSEGEVLLRLRNRSRGGRDAALATTVTAGQSIVLGSDGRLGQRHPLPAELVKRH